MECMHTDFKPSGKLGPSCPRGYGSKCVITRPKACEECTRFQEFGVISVQCVPLQNTLNQNTTQSVLKPSHNPQKGPRTPPQETPGIPTGRRSLPYVPFLEALVHSTYINYDQSMVSNSYFALQSIQYA